MTFNLNFPLVNGQQHQLSLEPGEILFVLGANGSGKSSLMFHFNAHNVGKTRKISAHRQTWMQSDSLDLTPSGKVSTEKNILQEDRNVHSRFRDSYASQRASLTIFDLIDSENIRARAIASAYDAQDDERLKEAGRTEAPITIINEILLESNMPIKISIEANERLTASKDGGSAYSASELSDGERNSLLIAGSVLTAPKGTLIIVDEPERHLHRSIISPLLKQLFARRSDCAFVVSTHESELPLVHSTARTLLLRSCSFSGGKQGPKIWEADELSEGDQIDDDLKRDLIGARRNILFVEGEESSIDKPLYSVMFPMISIVPKGSCKAVEQAVAGSRAAESLHWLKAFGIVDSDGFDDEQIAAKKTRGVYAVPYYSAEAIYFDPWIIERIASRQSLVQGGDPNELARHAIQMGVAAIKEHTVRLSKKAAMKSVRKSILGQIPNDETLLNGHELSIVNAGPTIHAERKCQLDKAVEDTDWRTILHLCPVRESPALDEISRGLKFKRRGDYLGAVRQLLKDDEDSLSFVRGLFGELSENVLR